MKTFVFTILFALIALLMPADKKKRIIFFGDSITESGVKPGGYLVRMDSMIALQGKADLYELVGSGISGNKIYDLYLRLDEDVLNKKPDVVVLYIGVNDVWHKRSAGTGTDPDKFEKFYNAILSKLAANNIKAVLCTPAVIGEKTDYTNEQDGDLNKYSNIIRGIADKNHLPLIDLRKIFGTGLKTHRHPTDISTDQPISTTRNHILFMQHSGNSAR
jgi:lysophospholipase L1-like esterase